MVDIINGCAGVYELYEVFNNLDNVFFCQDTSIHVYIETKFLIYTVASYFSQVITLVREEEVLEHLTCTCIISRVGIAQLPVDVEHSLLFRVAGILGKCIEDDGVLVGCLLVLMNEYRRNTAVNNIINIVLSYFCLTLDNDLVTLNRNDFTGILINEVLVPRLHHVTGKFASNSILKILLVDLDFLAEVENLKNILITLKADSTQKSSNR